MKKDEMKRKFSELSLDVVFNDLFMGERFDYALMHGTWYNLIEKLEKGGTLSNEELAYLRLYHLLFTIEGPFSFVINSIMWALLKVGYPYIEFEYQKKIVSSFDELFEINLSLKLKFLKDNGFDFIVEACPRKIRNIIAHQSYKIESDGSIVFNSKKVSLKQIINHTNKMEEIAELFFSLF